MVSGRANKESMSLAHPADAMQDVLKVSSFRFHNGMDSLSTDSRISKLSERRMTT